MKLQITPREKHIKRGYCCGNGCKLCPYEPRHEQGSTEIWECNPDGECWCKEEEFPTIPDSYDKDTCLSPEAVEQLRLEENLVDRLDQKFSASE